MRFPITVILSVIFNVLIVGPTPAQLPLGFRSSVGAMVFRGSAGNAVVLLQKKEVQMELRLTRAQIQKLKALDDDFSEKMYREAAEKMSRGGADLLHRVLDADELHRILEEWLLNKGTKTGEELAAGVLKPEQLKRLKEISLQRRGVQAYTDSEVAKALALTDTQKDKIEAICWEEERKMKNIFARDNRLLLDPPADALKPLETLIKETNDKAAGVLTQAQNKTWRDLTGKPFEFK